MLARIAFAVAPVAVLFALVLAMNERGFFHVVLPIAGCVVVARVAFQFLRPRSPR